MPLHRRLTPGKPLHRAARSVVAALLYLALRQVHAVELHVATDGNDMWLGRATAPNAAKTDGPFATLERARAELRALKGAGQLDREGATVWVHDGLYELTRTFSLTAADSGGAFPVVFRAVNTGRAVLIGGRQITHFTPHRGQVLKADVNAQDFVDTYFRQLFFAGKRQHLARYPNFDPKNPNGGGWAYADGKLVPMYQDVPGEDRRTFTRRVSDVRHWSRPGDVEVFVFPRYNWWNNIERIHSLDDASRGVTLARDCSYPIRPGDRYYFRNALEELDAPGEWYLDKAGGTLYFWPPAPLESGPVYAPTTRTILELGPGTAHVTIRGFTIECAEGDAVVLKNTTNCLISACTIRNVGDYRGTAVSVNGGVRNGVVGCDIHEVGSHGIHLSGGDRKTLKAAENYADNNYIHHVGVFYKQGVGISLTGVGNRASHNLIHDGPRMGIMFSGNNLVLEYNHLRHLNLETEDTGAVYTGGRDWISSRGTVIRYNYFHDMLGFGHDEQGRWISPRFAWGVYLDDNTGGVDVIGNIIARCSRAGLHLHNGRDNFIANNILIENGQQQFEYSGWTTNHSYWKDHLPSMIQGFESVASAPAWQTMRNMRLHPTNAVLPDGKIMSGNVFTRNIVAWRGPDAKLVRFGSVSCEHNITESNLYWHAGRPLKTGLTRTGRELSTNLAPHGGFVEGAASALPKDWSWQVRPKGAQAALVTDAGSLGKFALRVDGAVNTDEKGKPQYLNLVSQNVPVQPGHHYRIRARLKATKPDARASLILQSYVANAYFWASSPGDARSGTSWKNFEFSFRVPARGEKGWHEQMKTFRLRIDYREPDGALFVDGVTLHEVEALDEWSSWQDSGMDRHSLVTDPLFEDPDKDDFRLKPNSPALRLGFEPIPFEKIGPYSSELRASWPIVEAEGAREKPLNAAGR